MSRTLLLLAIVFCYAQKPLLAQLEQTARFPHVPFGGSYASEIIVTSIMPPGTPPTQVTLTVKNQQGEIQAAPSSILASGDRYSFPLPSGSSTQVSTVSVFSTGRFTSYGTISTPTFDLVINPELERSSFKIGVDTGTQAGVEVNTGIAVANFSSGSVRVNAYLKDAAFKDTDGYPLTAATTNFTLQPGQQTAKFTTEMFPAIAGTTFHGEIWFTTSDPSLQNATTSVVPLGLRTKNVPNLIFSFSPITVTSLPYASIAEITNQQLRLVYFSEKDQVGNRVAGYATLFPQALQLAQRIVAIENERGGYGYKTFSFNPVVTEVTGAKNFSEYPIQSILRIGEVVAEVDQQLGPGPKIIIAGNNLGFANSGSRITLADKIMPQVKLIVALINAGRTSVGTNEVVLGADDLFNLAHEVGHFFGVGHATDIDESIYGGNMRNFMTAFHIGSAMAFANLWPGIKLTAADASTDMRYPTFSASELKTMSIVQIYQCPTGPCLLQPMEPQ